MNRVSLFFKVFLTFPKNIFQTTNLVHVFLVKVKALIGIVSPSSVHPVESQGYIFLFSFIQDIFWKVNLGML